jgi:hypothetical protein
MEDLLARKKADLLDPWVDRMTLKISRLPVVVVMNGGINLSQV